MKEVTSEYFGENKITVSITPSDKKYVYLGMFHIPNYIPIDITKRKKAKATFRNVEPNVIYQPLYPSSSSFKPAGYSFFYDGEKIHYFIPDTTQKTTVTLSRKFPIREHSRQYRLELIGAKIEGANSSDFKQADLLYEIKDTFTKKFNSVRPLKLAKYRYVRFISAPDKRITLAGLHFCRDMHSTDILPASISPCEPSQPFHTLKYLNDSDPISSFRSKEFNQQLVYDFGRSVDIGKIVIIPLHDDNFIRSGDEYELFYQDGSQGWVSLGKQKATGDTLQFLNAPKDALFWLRDHTQGIEEEIFWIKDGKQIFLMDLQNQPIVNFR